jgi:hypothetical protein
MELQHSCKEAIASCLDQKTFAVSHLYNDDNRFYSIEPGIFSSLISMKATI